MKITQVEPQRKNPNRFNIFLDGVFAFGADEDTVVNYRLIVGKEIPPEQLPKILFETEIGKLMERMYVLFSRRQRSEKEVRGYLRNLSFKRKIKAQEELSELVIESLIQRLKQKGILNDEQFAKSWVEARRRSKKTGKIALKFELYQKGFNKDLIEGSLEDISEESEEKLATQALDKKLKVWQNLPYLERKKKALEFLVRRGFDYSLAKDVVEKELKKG